MDNYSKKLKMLQELDSKTDWKAAIEREKMKSAEKLHVKDTVKLTKSQKKRLKLEKQQLEVQKSLRAKNIETVVYTNPDSISAKLKKQNMSERVTSTSNPTVESDVPGIDIDMRKTRFEIMKFGMNSLKARDLEDAETSLALSLGAKPNPKPSVNYKELQAQRKKARDLEKEEASTSIKPKLNFTLKKKAPKASTKKTAKGDHRKNQDGGKGRSIRKNSKLPRNRNRSNLT